MPTQIQEGYHMNWKYTKKSYQNGTISERALLYSWAEMTSESTNIGIQENEKVYAWDFHDNNRRPEVQQWEQMAKHADFSQPPSYN